MTTKTLRKLAKEYAEGSLDRESYRKARDNFFVGVTSGQIKVEPIDFLPPVQVMDMDDTFEKTAIRPYQPGDTDTIPDPAKQDPATKNTAQTTQPVQAENTAGFPYLMVSAILLILAGIAISIALIQSPDEQEQETAEIVQEISIDTSIPDTPTEMQAEINHDPAAEKLIKNFLNENDWSDANLFQFKQNWQNLTEDQKHQGLSSPMQSQLRNAIHKKLLEQQALLGLGDTEKIIASQQRLLDFANDLKISDSRLKVVEAP